MQRPATRYADAGGVSVAYCRGDSEAVDVIVVPGFATHLEAMWEPPFNGRLFDRFSRFACVTQIEKRGVGLSDRISAPVTYEQRMDDLRAVMDAEDIARAVIVGISDGAALAALLAAAHPERVAALVLWAGGAGPRADPADSAAILAWVESVWGSGQAMAALVRVASELDVERLGRLERYALSPRAARSLLQMNLESDIRAALPIVSAPTLVVHRTGDPVTPRERAITLAGLIPGARRVELPGDWHMSLIDDAEDDAVDVIEEFITGAPPVAPSEVDHILATVLFTDIVDSTPKAAALGDRRWRDLLDAHDAVAVTEIDRHGGTMVKSTGDGVLARFDGPVRGIRCAQAIIDRARDLDLQIRAGLHVGGFQIRGADLAGLTVHIGARVAALASAGEVCISSTVGDLIGGSGLSLVDRGRHELKGVPGEWQVLAVATGE